jgi:hypothetical protein
MVRDTNIAISVASVNKAAPLASQAKILSAMGPERGLFFGGGFVML